MGGEVPEWQGEQGTGVLIFRYTHRGFRIAEASVFCQIDVATLFDGYRYRYGLLNCSRSCSDGDS